MIRFTNTEIRNQSAHINRETNKGENENDEENYVADGHGWFSLRVETPDNSDPTNTDYSPMS